NNGNGADDDDEDEEELPPAYQIDRGEVRAHAFAASAAEDAPQERQAEPEPEPGPPPPEEEKKSIGGNGRGDFGGFGGYPHGEQERGRIAMTFVYQNADGSPHLQVRKFEWIDKNGKRRKSYPQYRRANGQWVKGKPEGPAIPYRLPQLLEAPLDAVIDIFAGEKDADRGAEHGLIATTNPEGETMPDGVTGKWQPELNEYFRGRPVRIHQDNDVAGEAHVAKVASELRGIAKEIQVVRY